MRNTIEGYTYSHMVFTYQIDSIYNIEYYFKFLSGKKSNLKYSNTLIYIEW